ncbi:MAG: hypothetical protein GF364_19075 [Candidatus Lokiarchaeota archaeon]|nr:hypothetical protein [Candidatus Lokiarchaeota archaeon]
MNLKKEILYIKKASKNLLKFKLNKKEVEYIDERLSKIFSDFEEKKWKNITGENRQWINVFEKGNQQIKVSLIHGRKGETITGADFAFEWKKKKVIFVQSKRISSSGRIKFDRSQLYKLIQLEAKINNSKICPNCFNPISSIMNSTSFYHLIMRGKKNKVVEKYLPVGEVNFILAGYLSRAQKHFLYKGITPDEFMKLFWECKIGGPDVKNEIKKDVFEFYSLQTNHLIVWLEYDNSI